MRRNTNIFLLEVGCTTEETKSITGHKTDEMVKLYAKGVRQKLLAQRAMDKMKAAPGSNKVANKVANITKNQNR
ncbi:hypothetical protein [Kiloniella sp. EL199]|uniref:hypothetical protein n=1 Tax=Kiloniella sp. EL199 TaxID=2107581 RepID=UPI0013C40C18|nr:hypothetical protein [Kiloniella sp. EL199]